MIEQDEAQNGNAMQQVVIAARRNTNLNIPCFTFQVRELFNAFNNADQDGRVLVSAGVEPAQCNVQYIMLNAATHFDSIIHEAKVTFDIILDLPRMRNN